MTEFNEKDLLQAARKLRQERERALDELTIARLRAARLNAVATKHHRARFWGIAGGIAATGFALALAGVVWLRGPADIPATPVSEPTLADLDLLSTESPEFYGNLDFYRWLASQSDSG